MKLDERALTKCCASAAYQNSCEEFLWKNNPTIRHINPGSRPLLRHEDPVPIRQPRTGQLQPSQPQQPNFQQRYQSSSPENSELITPGHSKPRVRCPSTASPDRTPATMSYPADDDAVTHGLFSTKRSPLEVYYNNGAL